MAIAAFDMREGTLSGIITLVMIWNGVAPMLSAASIMLGLTSRRLPSTRRATNGNAAITSGTIDAAEPIVVPTMSRVSGKTTTMRMMNGTERRRFTIIFIVFINQRGSGRIPPLSPQTSITPSGRPKINAKTVAITVT